MKTFPNKSLVGLILMAVLAQFPVHAQDILNPYDVLKRTLTFYASFDNGLTADYTSGDDRLILAPAYDQVDSLKYNQLPDNIEWAKGEGYTGNALHFMTKDKPVIYYSGKNNITYASKNWSGTISLWLRLNPEEDLAPGYTDPIQITDVGYDDAALWVDFSNVNPREFRMGVYGDRTVWNPDNIGPDENPKFQNRLVVAKYRPFSREEWTHVVISFENLNSENGMATFYINGKLQGYKKIKEPFTWDIDKTKIYLGLSYIGYLDDVAIFNRALGQREVVVLHHWKGGLLEYLGGEE